MPIRIYTSGVFDLFHAGHLQALEMAKQQGDVLLVGVLSDEDANSYKRLPIIPFQQRLAIVQSIDFVDETIAGPKYEPADFYQNHKIDYHCQGEEIDGFYEVAKELDLLKILGRSPITETSEIIQRIVQRDKDAL